LNLLTKIHKPGHKAKSRISLLMGMAAALALWWQLSQRGADWNPAIFNNFLQSPLTWAVSFILSGLNWGLRIYKWQQLAGHVRPVTFRDALCQTLKTFSWSAVIPFNGGEILSKPLFFGKHRKKLFSLSTWEQLSQMAVTVTMGLTALLWHGKALWKPAAMAVLSYRGTQNIRYKALIWSWWRYLAFGGLMTYMLTAHAQVPLAMALVRVPLYYLAVSVVPIIQWAGWAWQGNMALLVFPSAEGEMLMAVVWWLWAWQTLLPMTAGGLLLMFNRKCGYVD